MRLLSKMFLFQGRDTRSDFLIYIVGSVLVITAALYASVALDDAYGSGAQDDGQDMGPFAWASFGVLILLTAAVRILSTCRRLRDSGKSLWLALMLFIPALGGLLTIYLMFFRSEPDRLTEDAVKVF